MALSILVLAANPLVHGAAVAAALAWVALHVATRRETRLSV